MMNKELKDCPFCGNIPVLETMTVRKGWEADIQCNNCGASIHTITFDTETEAVRNVTTTWNCRVTSK